MVFVLLIVYVFSCCVDANGLDSDQPLTNHKYQVLH